MIIIDQNTDVILAATLEKARRTQENARCIHLSMRSQPGDDAFKEKVIAAARQFIASPDMQVFLCGDGDIFILAPLIPTRNGREFIVEVAEHLGRPADESWTRFVELPLHLNTLLVEAEAKLARRREAEEARRRQMEQAQAARKRQAILSGGNNAHGNFRERRAARTTPEMMIIEDDVFSRRLVENVLQKKYPLTGLGEATRALDTYARLAPDLLFLDINLPDVTGHELLEKIIALDPDAYVIMLSGNCDRENILQAMSRGAKGFLAKPFTKEKLFQYVDQCPTIREK